MKFLHYFTFFNSKISSVATISITKKYAEKIARRITFSRSECQEPRKYFWPQHISMCLQNPDHISYFHYNVTI